MAFRQDEATKAGLEDLRNYLIPRNFSDEDRESSEEKLEELIEEYGVAVDSYPSWHPLVTNYENEQQPATTPGNDCGYEGLDHTRYLLNAFITCPYGDGQKVLDAVKKFKWTPFGRIHAERLDVKFYNTNATPILVYFDWEKELLPNKMIPAKIAVPLMLIKEVPCCEWSSVAEPWENMRHYLLGSPAGSRSSLFVSQETGAMMKKIWEMLIQTGMWGPLKFVSR